MELYEEDIKSCKTSLRWIKGLSIFLFILTLMLIIILFISGFIYLNENGELTNLNICINTCSMLIVLGLVCGVLNSIFLDIKNIKKFISKCEGEKQ